VAVVVGTAGDDAEVGGRAADAGVVDGVVKGDAGVVDGVMNGGGGTSRRTPVTTRGGTCGLDATSEANSGTLMAGSSLTRSIIQGSSSTAPHCTRVCTRPVTWPHSLRARSRTCMDDEPSSGARTTMPRWARCLSHGRFFSSSSRVMTKSPKLTFLSSTTGLPVSAVNLGMPLPAVCTLTVALMASMP